MDFNDSKNTRSTNRNHPRVRFQLSITNFAEFSMIEILNEGEGDFPDLVFFNGVWLYIDGEDFIY